MRNTRKGFVLSCAVMFVVAFAPEVAQASVSISSNPTSNMTCSAGICSPTAKKAVLNVTDLTNMLASGDVKITTGNGAVTITVFSLFSWTSTYRLTLDAYETVSFRAPVTVAGTGAVTIVTNDGGTGGDLIFFPGASLDFWDLNSNLVINGSRYVLAANIASLKLASTKYSAALANGYDAKKDHFRDTDPIQHQKNTLEGLGHTIANLSIVSRKNGACVGFIGVLHGAVRDLILTDANVLADSFGVGSLVGCNDGWIANASASGNVHADETTAGGLVGINNADGTIVGSHADVSIIGGSGYSNPVYIGGLVGSSSGAVFRSYAEGTVQGGQDDNGKGLYLGGLAGQCANCDQTFATGDVTGYGYPGVALGGLVGKADGVTNSYSTGEVTASYGAGGGFAATGCCIATSYSLGAVKNSEGFLAAGFIADSESPYDFQSAYWDIGTSGQTQGCGSGDCSGVTGLSNHGLKSRLPKGFDRTIWAQSASFNSGYPYLLANPPPQ